MDAQVREQSQAPRVRFRFEQRDRFEHVERRRAPVDRLQVFDRALPFARGERRGGVVAGDQVEGGRLHGDQGRPGLQRLGERAALRGPLAGEDARARRLGRGVAGVLHRIVGDRGLPARVGLERDLAPVVRNARRERSGAALLELPGNPDGGMPVARTLMQA